MLWAAILSLFATVFGVSFSAAQQTVAGTPAETTIRKDIDQVALVLSVRDRKGRFVSDLGAEQFTIRDNGHPPQRVDFFQQQTDLPLRLAVLIDTSDSVSPVFKQEQEAAIQFLRETVRPNVDNAFIAGFNTKVTVVADTSSKLDLLSQAVRDLQTGGATALLDALHETGMRLKQHAGARQRRLIIVISDGADNSSQRGLSAAVESALRSEVAVYALSTNKESATSTYDSSMIPRPYPEDVLLRRLAEATGGSFLRVGKRAELNKAFARIQQELRTQYLLAYTPAQLVRDGSYRAIKVKVQGRSGLSVRCRKGYYAELDPSR